MSIKDLMEKPTGDEDIVTGYESEMKEMAKELLKIAKDSKVDAEWRVHAGRVLDGMNDSALKYRLMDDVRETASDMSQSQLRAAERLKKKNDYE